MRNPPIGLYVHIPWCVQKCPYCDFNSHSQKGEIPQQEYINHLLDDLDIDAKRINNRTIETIFIGGGTPSLLSEQSIDRLLYGIKQRVEVSSSAEITLEANPGTIEANRFSGYAQAGVNRFSIGVQSFQNDHLRNLGRIHDSKQAQNAIIQAKQSQIASFNIDLMHGLPDQSLDNAMHDLSVAISLQPNHLSWYQLTIEPNTPFYSKPPTLPDDDILWDIQDQGHELLLAAGYEQYEISGYSLKGHQCSHNLNYWRFGDYLGIGCGAHGKITDADSESISRTVKVKHPRGYMDLQKSYLYQETKVAKADRVFEFFMNQFRLVEPCSKQRFIDYTGTSLNKEHEQIFAQAQEQGLMDGVSQDYWQLTAKGRRYLNSLLMKLC